MAFKIEGIFEGEVDCKRFYMPGVKAHDNCPDCKKEIINDYEVHYISYPKIGKPCLLYFYCEDCSKDWTQKIQLDVSFSIKE